MKLYDRRYFDRWYRSPRSRIHQRAALERKVHVAVSAAEYLLGRRIQDVLDVGCGEAPWRAALKSLRPDVRYQGVDRSGYAVRRFGRTRNIRLGTLGTLAKLKLDGTYDLIVCSDVLHYVRTSEVRRGLATIAKLLHGMAWIEVFTGDDATIGDNLEYQERSPAVYRRLFREVGLIHCGNYCFVGEQLEGTLTQFERGQDTSGRE